MKKVVLLLGVIALVSCNKKADESWENYTDSAVAYVDSVSVESVDSIYAEDNVSDNEKDIQEMENKYINNSLSTGATPYAKYYGRNKKCEYGDCSQIKVVTSNSDVLVTIKKDDKVVRHAYIKANDSYTFSFPNGIYQAFFYYGRGWDPEKPMKNGEIKGGFIANEDFQKDAPQYLYNNILEYQLILQQNGNFNTRSSDSSEAL